MADAPVEVKKASAPQPVPDPWQSLRSEMDRLFDRFSAGFGFPALRRAFDIAPAFGGTFEFAAPAVDVTEDEAGFKLTAELPGLDEKDIEVAVRDDILVLKGEKRQEKEEKTQNRYVSERAYGAFERCFAVPPSVDRNKITAAFAKGVLTITLPKAESARQVEKKIEVKAA